MQHAIIYSDSLQKSILLTPHKAKIKEKIDRGGGGGVFSESSKTNVVFFEHERCTLAQPR